MDKLIGIVGKYFGIDKEIIKGASRKKLVARARSIICHLAVGRLMTTGAEVARKLNLSRPAVSKLADRGRNDSLAKRLERRYFF